MNEARITTLLGSVAAFLIALELTIISVALPEIERTFAGTPRSTLSWVFTAYNVGVASLLLIFGWAAERFGRKRLFLAGMAIFVIGSLGSGLAPGIGLLIAGRTVQAIGGAMLIPASLGLILAANKPADRDVAIGAWGSMAGLAAAVGPSVGAVLVDGAGWRWVFLVNVPVAVLTIIVGSKRLSESRDDNIAPRVDLVAVPVGALAIGLFVFIIVAAGSVGWSSPLTVGILVAALVLLAVFVRRSVNHPTPVFDPAIARAATFKVASVATLFFVAGLTGWLVLAPTFLTEVWGYSILKAGFAIAPGPAAMAVAWWMAFVGNDPAYLFAFLPGAVVLGIGVGAGFPMLTAAVMVDVPPNQYAIGAAGNTTVRQVAMALGIAAVIAVVGPPAEVAADAGPFRDSWLLCGLFFLVAGVVMTRFAPTVDLRRSDQATTFNRRPGVPEPVPRPVIAQSTVQRSNRTVKP